MSPPVAPAAAELTICADLRDARRASRWLASAGLAHNVPASQIERLDHCLDEALANLIRHGGPAALSSPVHLRLAVKRSGGACAAELSISDAGVAFDPSTHVGAARPATLADAKPGGLGLLLIRNFSDGLSYRRSDGRNHLTITACWPEVA